MFQIYILFSESARLSADVDLIVPETRPNLCWQAACTVRRRAPPSARIYVAIY